MKERFKTKDWERLQRLPILMFHFVSLADQELQEEEVAAFVAEIHDAASYKDPLHRELFFDLSHAPTFKKAYDSVMGTATDSVEAIEKELMAIKKILNKRLDKKEYHRFFVSLTGTGSQIAKAAGVGPSNVAPEEVAAIAVLVSKFEVDMAAGAAALGEL